MRERGLHGWWHGGTGPLGEISYRRLPSGGDAIAACFISDSLSLPGARGDSSVASQCPRREWDSTRAIGTGDTSYGHVSRRGSPAGRLESKSDGGNGGKGLAARTATAEEWVGWRWTLASKRRPVASVAHAWRRWGRCLAARGCQPLLQPLAKGYFFDFVPILVFHASIKTLSTIKAWGSGSFTPFAMLRLAALAALLPRDAQSASRRPQSCPVRGKPLRILIFAQCLNLSSATSLGCMRLQASCHCDSFSFPF
jgi:hypothetical protein